MLLIIAPSDAHLKMEHNGTLGLEFDLSHRAGLEFP